MALDAAFIASGASTIAAVSAASTSLALVVDTNDLSFNTMMLFAIAGTNAFAAVMAYRTHRLTLKVEVATNSMKDALVTSTAKASHAEGKAEGKAEEKIESGPPMTNAGHMDLAASKMGTAVDKMAITADKAENTIDKLSKK